MELYQRVKCGEDVYVISIYHDGVQVEREGSNNGPHSLRTTCPEAAAAGMALALVAADAPEYRCAPVLDFQHD